MVNTLNPVPCPSEACTQPLSAIPAHKYLLLYGIKVSVEPDDYSHHLPLCNVLWFFPALRASRNKSPHLEKKIICADSNASASGLQTTGPHTLEKG